MKDLYPVTRVVVPVASPNDLTVSDFDSYQQTGFLAVANVLTQEVLDDLCHEIDLLLQERITDTRLSPEPAQQALFNSLPVGERAHLVRKLMHFVDAAPHLRAASEHATVLSIVERLVGEKVRLIQDMALVKPAHVGSEKPWHQDLAYFDWHPADRVVGVWIALDTATVENGCMFLLPGSQAVGPVPHQHLRDCQIPDEQIATENCVAVPLEPGGALFFHSLLHHGTPHNNSPMGRRAVQYHYAGLSCTKRSLKEHANDFFAGDLYAGCRTTKTLALNEIQ
jgi:phytanoyl-CoA hydroxylase